MLKDDHEERFIDLLILRGVFDQDLTQTDMKRDRI